MYYTDLSGETRPAEKGCRVLDGKSIVTWSREIESANLLEVEAGTNGYHGGNSSNGSRTYLRFQDEGCTCTIKDRYGRDEGFELILGGDSELKTTIEALRWIISILEAQSETGADENA